jgi:serine/threonine-protein kinase
VSDFGLAKATEASMSQSLSTSGVVVGTYRYISPEQTDPRMKVDGRADIYSLGVVLYEMLTGRLPFEGESAAQLIRGHVLEPPEPPSNIVPTLPLAVESVVLKALKKEPDERFSTAGQMARALKEAIEQGRIVPGV